VFNLSLIALMEHAARPQPIFSRAEHSHNLSAGFGVILIGFATLSVAAAAGMPSFGRISLSTPIIIGLYALSMRSVFLFQKRQAAPHIGEIAPELQYEPVKLTVLTSQASGNPDGDDSSDGPA